MLIKTSKNVSKECIIYTVVPTDTEKDKKYNYSAKKNGLVFVLNKNVNFLRVVVYIIIGVLALEAFIVVNIIDFNYEFESLFQFNTAKSSQKAALFISPNILRSKVGEEFSVDVLADTKNNNVVVSAAYLSYNKEKLEAVSIDTSQSDFVFFAEKEILKDTGKIKITGGKPTPGVNSSNVKIASIKFKVLDYVESQSYDIGFDFTRNSSRYSTIILDDKKGTNILFSTHGVKVYLE